MHELLEHSGVATSGRDATTTILFAQSMPGYKYETHEGRRKNRDAQQGDQQDPTWMLVVTAAADDSTTKVQRCYYQGSNLEVDEQGKCRLSSCIVTVEAAFLHQGNIAMNISLMHVR